MAIARYLPDGDILDLGCGNGYTLISLAKDRSGSRMVGVDFSENLTKGARLLAEKEGVPEPPKFVCADAIEYISNRSAESVDGIITERFLQNMPDRDTQQRVIQEIYRVLRRRGRYLMCEGSSEGFHGLNALRRPLGLEEIPETSVENLSAIRFDDVEIEHFTTESVGFNLLDKLGFSDYFVISRVLHPLLVAPQRPRFNARINDLAGKVQAQLPLRPGIGSNVIWVLEKQ
jgi:ubiquinone/menaquinone biosynthesis C-methylase UbiE